MINLELMEKDLNRLQATLEGVASVLKDDKYDHEVADLLAETALLQMLDIRTYLKKELINMTTSPLSLKNNQKQS